MACKPPGLREISASKGIGAKICFDAAKAGWACAVNFASDAPGAARVVATIEEAGGTVIAAKADISNADGVSIMFKAVDEAFDPVTGVVKNAGTMGSQGRAEDLDVARTCRLLRWIHSALYLQQRSFGAHVQGP